VKVYLAAASWRKSEWSLVRQLRGPHLRTWGVVEQAIEQSGDGGSVPEELAPVIDGAV